MRPTLSRLALLAALAASITGCPTPDDPVDAGGGEGGDGGAGRDGGDADAGPEPGLRTLAIDDLSLSAGQDETGRPASAYRLATRFDDACDVVDYGDCRYELCRQGSTSERRPDYGEVRFVSDTVDERFEPLSTNGIYGLRDRPGEAAWIAGPVSISGAGAALPAFDETFDVPSPITLDAPAVGDTSSLSRGDSIEVRWSGGVAGTQALLRLRSSLEVIRCAVPAERGSLTVPAEAISRLIPEGAFGPISVVGGLSARTGVDLEVGSGRVLRLSASDGAGSFTILASP